MTDLRKAAEMAFTELCNQRDAHYTKDIPTELTQAIQALREALAQPEQEHMADNLIRTYVSAAMANNKNLVAEATKEMINYVCSFIENTAAPKREWDPLTDDEYDELLTGDWGGSLIRRVEAKLKEKNGG